MKNLIIDNIEIRPGEEKRIDLNVAQLPSRTKIDIPVTVFRGEEEGPTLLLMAGLHGDEINGIEIIRRILDENLNHVKRGTTICIPILNVFGFINFSREVPDGKDVNRSFPGSANGSLAWKVAYELMNKIMPVIDFGIDFHTGGAQRSNYPQLRCVLEKETNQKIARMFHPRFLIDSDLIHRTLRWAADKEGKEILVFEGGQSLQFDQSAIQAGVDGTVRVMKGFGMRDYAPEANHEMITIVDRDWIRCKDAGIWLHDCHTGDYVKEGDLLGFTSSPFGDFRSEIYAPHDGYVIGLNHLAVVNRGDALIHIGYTRKM